MLLRAKAPLRIPFAGGGTDVPPFPEREGGCVLSATIGRYAYATLRPRDDERITIESVDFGIARQFEPADAVVLDGELDLAKAAIAGVAGGAAGRGFDLLLHSDVPPGSGLGSSSAMMVALIGVLAEFRGLALGDHDLAELAVRIERHDLGSQGGLQDQYAAAFGGFNLIEFRRDGTAVTPVPVDRDVLLELEYDSLLVFTGTTRSADHVIEHRTVEGLRRQKELAVEMRDALVERRLGDFGTLLAESWETKKLQSDRISSPLVDAMYEEALRHGALGGKLAGAGGGGFLVFICGPGSKHRVAAALERLGGHVEPLAFEQHGMRTWRAP